MPWKSKTGVQTTKPKRGLVNPILSASLGEIKEEILPMDKTDYVGTLNEIDELNTRLACGLNALSAIHEAILYGTVEAREWKDGLFGVYDYMSGIQSQIEKAVDNCREQCTATPSNDGN